MKGGDVEEQRERRERRDHHVSKSEKISNDRGGGEENEREKRENEREKERTREGETKIRNKLQSLRAPLFVQFEVRRARNEVIKGVVGSF